MQILAFVLVAEYIAGEVHDGGWVKHCIQHFKERPTGEGQNLRRVQFKELRES